MNSRPPAMAGCDRACVTSAMPNAHLSFSFGTSAALSRAWSCGWKRVLLTPAPHPFQRAPVAGSVTGGVVRQAPASVVCANADEIGTAMRITQRINCFMRVSLTFAADGADHPRHPRLPRTPVSFRSIFQEWLFYLLQKGARSPDSCLRP